MRWLARPIRCMIRLAPFGAPTLTTRSTSPQSMPRSRVAVQTIARSWPAAIAASTRRRCCASREPWWMAIGSASSLSRHSSWKVYSAWRRVFTKTSVVRCVADQVVDRRHRVPGGVAGDRQGPAEVEHAQIRLRAAGHGDEVGHGRRILPSPCGVGGRGEVGASCGTRYFRSSSGSRTVADRARSPSRPGLEPVQPGQRRARAGRRASRSPARAARPGPRSAARRRTPRPRDGRSAAPAARAWSAGCRAAG